jgi:hypothetical protein
MIPRACQQKPTEALAAPKGDPRDKPNKEGSQRLVSSSTIHPLPRGQWERGTRHRQIAGKPTSFDYQVPAERPRHGQGNALGYGNNVKDGVGYPQPSPKRRREGSPRGPAAARTPFTD